MRDIKEKIKAIKELNLKDAAKPRFYEVNDSLSVKDQALQIGKEVICGCHLPLNSHNHTYFSLLDGISSPENMVNMTAMRGFGGIGISDHGTMGGVLKAGKAGKNWKIGKLKSDGTSFIYTKAKIKDYSKKFELCDENWSPLGKELTNALASEIKGEVSIVHNTQKPSQYRILDDSDFEKNGDFTVLSGCELYVSWKKDRDKKYNHITVYATGQKGHRALVLLTSIGAIPSRRYIGARGFFRPRVYVEDIETAIKEADGELIVTTGCPISITSDAIREGRDDDARAFFEWGKRVLPPGRFFAELHLCDVSLDFNKKHAMAEDKYYSSVFSVPVSRFRHDNIKSALDYAKTFLSRVKLYTVSEGVRGYKMHHEGSFRDATPDYMLHQSAKSDSTDGLVLYLKDAGINLDKYEMLSKEDLLKAKDLSKEISIVVEGLLKAGSSQEPSDKKKARNFQMLDEDTLSLLSAAASICDRFDSGDYEKADRTRYAALNFIARFALSVIAEIGLNEKDLLEYVNPTTVIKSIFSVPFSHSNIGSKDDAQELMNMAHDRVLLLDQAKDVAYLPNHQLFAAARSLAALIELSESTMENLGLSELNPSSGSEDMLEKEWVKHPEGNWMEKVNYGLTRIAKEFDVPLLMATDAHMTMPELKPVQDAIMKRGKRRAWHMSRPYAIPRSDVEGFIEDVGGGKVDNFAQNMIKNNCITVEDIIEGFGSGAVILNDAKSVSTFKWDIVVPKIKYENHPMYNHAKSLLDSGMLRDFLPKKDSGAKFTFTEASIDIPTALIVAVFINAVETGLIPNEESYYERLLSEIHLQQEVPGAKLADFFLVLGYVIDKWRQRGISVGPGRGSSGGMLTAHVNGITFGDPVKKGFLESRWMNPDRKAGSPADIDIDVSDRQLAGYELAKVAQESFAASVEERPLSPLEVILHSETFFSSNAVTHDQVGLLGVGASYETQVAKKDIKSGFVEAIDVSKNKKKINRQDNQNDSDANELDVDSVDALNGSFDEDNLMVVMTPIFRVGTYGSLKAKAAVKEAIRILDNTPFEKLPPFADPTTEWMTRNKNRISNLSDDGISELYESETFSDLSVEARTARRRVRLADRITKDMQANAGLSRLYQSEFDYFMGAVYGVVPDYWDPGMRQPTGSKYAEKYFEDNKEVKELILDFLNIYKSAGVHAGGMCFGREAFERVPVRADKHGYVGTFEMKDLDTVGILKFDVLGLRTLTQIDYTLKLIVEEMPYDQISWWLPRDIYDRVKGGESTDIMWRFIPMSTSEASRALIETREMTFQVDTKVFGKELDKIDPEAIVKITNANNNDKDKSNDKLVDILNALLALFRPGPMKMNGHVSYINRLQGLEKVEVIHPWMMNFVKDTFGILTYQEQVMAIWQSGAIDLNADGSPKLDANGNFIKASGADADNVRRAMGKKDIKAMASMDAEGRFVRGLKAQGISQEIAMRIWEQIIPFAEYGFNSPHSYHYGLISAVTLFLTAHYKEYFFRVSLGLSAPSDALRFIGSIAKDTKPVCVLRSKETFWKVYDKAFFPSLSFIEGVKTKDVEKILNAQKILTEKYGTDNLVGKVSAEEFFTVFGELTPSVASLLAESGALRSLGSKEEIVKGYELALVNTLAPRKERKKKKTVVKEVAVETSDKAVGAVDIEDSVLDDLVFDVRDVGEADATEEVAVEQKEVVTTAITETKSSVQANAEAPSVFFNKKEREVLDILRKGGVEFLSVSDQEKLKNNSEFPNPGNILTVDSAVNLVINDKAKTAMGHLVASLAARDQIENVDTDVSWISLRELKSGHWSDGRPIDLDRAIYKTVAIPQNVGSSTYSKDGNERMEPRISWTSEGVDLNMKFKKEDGDLVMTQEQLDQVVSAVKDGKMKTPFVIKVFANSFTNRSNGEKITYFHMLDVKRCG